MSIINSTYIEENKESIIEELKIKIESITADFKKTEDIKNNEAIILRLPAVGTTPDKMGICDAARKHRLNHFFCFCRNGFVVC